MINASKHDLYSVFYVYKNSQYDICLCNIGFRFREVKKN
jgi:hypothetical protein